jgi:hypothetical protein
LNSFGAFPKWIPASVRPPSGRGWRKR